jgi:hypothetical protein
VRHARIPEVDVGINQPGEDMESGRVDCLFPLRQRVVGTDRHDLAARDGNTALQRGFRCNDRSVLNDQICFHDILLFPLGNSPESVLS